MKQLFVCLFFVSVQFSSVQSFSHVWLFATARTPACQASLSTTSSQSLLKLMSIESGMPYPSHPLSSPSPLTFNPSQHQGLFQWVSSSHKVAKGWSFSFNISPSNEQPGLISFRMDWLDLLAVQGTCRESSPTAQFKSINSSPLSFLYTPILTLIHDYWKNQSFD